MRGRAQPKPKVGELTFAELAEAVEDVFGAGCVGLCGASEDATDEGRSAFVRASLYLIVLQRMDWRLVSQEAIGDLKRKITREVREELATLLEVDVNEVFRLHHHAAGLRAKDGAYRAKAREIERTLARRHGLGV